MRFGLVGKSNVEIERFIKKLGGKVTAAINSQLTAVISTKNEVRKMGTKMLEVQNHQIPVVSKDFLTEIQTPGVDPIGYIRTKSICNWGEDVSVLKSKLSLEVQILCDNTFSPLLISAI